MAVGGGARGGKDGAWDSFEDLMRAVTFPRKKHNFTNFIRFIDLKARLRTATLNVLLGRMGKRKM